MSDRKPDPQQSRRDYLKQAAGTVALPGMVAVNETEESHWQRERRELAELYGNREAKILVELSKNYWKKIKNGSMEYNQAMELLADEAIAHNHTPKVTEDILDYRKARTKKRARVGLSGHPKELPDQKTTEETTSEPSRTLSDNGCTVYPEVYLDQEATEETRSVDFWGATVDTYYEADPGEAHIEHFVAVKGIGQATIQTRMWGYLYPDYSTTYEVGTWVDRCGAVANGGSLVANMYVQNTEDGSGPKPKPTTETYSAGDTVCGYHNFANQHTMIKNTLYRVGLNVHTEAAGYQGLDPRSADAVEVVDFAEKNNDYQGFDIYKDQFRCTPLDGVCNG